MDKNSKFLWITNQYWRLDQYSCILVVRNKLWFEHAVVEIEKVWNTIIKEKETGYQHRAPKRKAKKETTIDLEKSGGCLISISDISAAEDSTHLNIDLDLPSQNKEDIVIEAKNNNNQETTIIHIKTDSLEKTQEETQLSKES